VIAQTPLSTREEVDRAVTKAQEAFWGWAATPVVERARLLFRFKMLLEEHFEELRDLVTLENGKDAKDAGGEVRRDSSPFGNACSIFTENGAATRRH
jgi:malonate-semialdehyde dehydrogenase (acetylating)/methylmalonate-semialdehyde dehydrogenase